MISTKTLHNTDAEVFSAVHDELKRQENKIELIASENFTSLAVMEAQGSVLTNKYAEGYPGKRYYGGCEFVDEIEDIARERARRLFGANYANVQPHSGSQANMAAYFALLDSGDTVLSMALAHGGHLTHGTSVNFSGKQYRFSSYGVEPDTEVIDYDKLMDQAKALKPKLIVAGSSSYSRIIDFAAFREIADACGALLMADMAHIAGLVAAGEHPSPVPYCDIVTTTTHKTLRGPRGGMILTNNEDVAKAVDKAVFPGIQGGPLMHVIAAKAVALGEALQPEFKEYAANVRKNAKVLADTLTAKGLRIVSGGTDNHMMLVDLRKMGITGREAQNILDEACITCNKNGIPFDTQKPVETSGIRLGTAACTTRGFDEEAFAKVAEAIVLCLNKNEDDFAAGKAIVKDLTARYPLYPDIYR